MLEYLRYKYSLGYSLTTSQVLALIFYQDTLKNFVYDTDASGNAILTNKGSGEDGLLNTGRGLELGADNDLHIPIAHTLVGELFNNSIYSNSADSTETPIADGVNIVGDGSEADSLSGNLHFSTTTNETNKTMVIEFYATIIAGSLTLAKIYNGTEVIDIPDHTIVNGYNKIEVPSGSSFNSIQLYYNGSISYNIDFAYSTCSVKEVTNPNSYLTIVHGDGSVEQIDNSDNTPSTHYTFNNQTILETMPTTAPFTTADLALIQADTTLLARLSLGEDNAGGLSLVTADVYSWYPFTENEGAYVVDVKAGLGNGLTGDNSVIDGTNNTISFSNDIFTIHSETATTTPTRPYMQRIGAVATDILLRVVVDIKVISGECKLYSINHGDGLGGNTSTIYSQVINSNTTIVLYTYNRTTDSIEVTFEGNTTYIYDIEVNFTAKEVTAEEITNYIAPIRENVDQNPKGLQTNCLELDGAGVHTAVDFTKLHWYGVGYNDTQTMLPSDGAWEIDLVLETLANSTDKANGIVGAAVAQNLFIGQDSANKLWGGIGNATIISAAAVPDAWYHIRIEFDGAGNGNVVINNTTTIPYSSSSYTYSASERFFLGARSRAGAYHDAPMTTPTGFFQVVDRVRTSDERTADYNKAKEQHPTLP